MIAKKLQIEIKTATGTVQLFDLDISLETVFKGEKQISIICPWLVNFESSYEAMDTLTDYRGTFELVHHCFIEGCITSGDIWGDKDAVLASYQILIDGNPATYDEFQTLKA